MQTSHFKAGEILMTYFWKHYCLMDQQNCVPHCLICHECHWEITPIDFTVMTLVCCVLLQSVLSNITMMKSQRGWKKFALNFQPLYYSRSWQFGWLRHSIYQLHACGSVQVKKWNPKNRSGWGPSNKNISVWPKINSCEIIQFMGVTFFWLAPSLTVCPTKHRVQ